MSDKVNYSGTDTVKGYGTCPHCNCVVWASRPEHAAKHRCVQIKNAEQVARIKELEAALLCLLDALPKRNSCDCNRCTAISAASEKGDIKMILCNSCEVSAECAEQWEKMRTSGEYPAQNRTKCADYQGPDLIALQVENERLQNVINELRTPQRPLWHEVEERDEMEARLGIVEAKNELLRRVIFLQEDTIAKVGAHLMMDDIEKAKALIDAALEKEVENAVSN